MATKVWQKTRHVLSTKSSIDGVCNQKMGTDFGVRAWVVMHDTVTSRHVVD